MHCDSCWSFRLHLDFHRDHPLTSNFMHMQITRTAAFRRSVGIDLANLMEGIEV
jgi:hypothetical protein